MFLVLTFKDPDVLEAAHRGFVKMVPKKPYPTLKGIQFLLDQFSATIPQAKSAKPQQFVDLTLLQDLEREGVFCRTREALPVTGL